MDSSDPSSDISDVLQPLQDLENGALKEFLKEYQSWQETLRKSREAQEEHVRRCKDLIQEKDALELQSAGILDQANRKTLELQSCQERTMEMKLKGEKIQEEIIEKKKKFSLLSERQELLGMKLDNLDNMLKEENEKKEREMYQQVEKLGASREVFQSKVNRMWGENLELQQSLQALQMQKDEEQKEINEILNATKQIDLKIKGEVRRNAEYLQNIELGEIDIAQEKQRLEVYHQTIADYTSLVNEVERKFQETEEMLGDDVKELDGLHQRTDLLSKDVQNQLQEQCRLQEKLEREKMQLEQTRAKSDTLEEDHSKVKRKNDLLQSKFVTLDKSFNQCESERKRLEAETEESKMQHRALQIVKENHEKQKLLLFREKTVMSQELNVQKTSEVKLKTEAFMQESTVKSFENELASIKVAKSELKKMIAQLQKNLRRLEADIHSKEMQKVQTLEQVAEQDVEIERIRRSIAESELSLKKQDNLLDAVRKDRDLYNKMTLEQRGEMQEFRRQFVGISDTIRRVNLELREKDKGFLVEHFNVDQVDKDVLITRSKIGGLNKKVVKSNKLCQQQAKQIEALGSIISDAEGEQKNEKKLLESIINEDRLLTQRLVAKNAELKNLYEELRLLNSLFLKGKTTYEEKLKSIHSAREKTLQKEETLEELHKQISMHQESLQDTSAKDKKLVALKLKIRAFTDELQRPVNIHRWRTMVDTHPEIHDLIQKAQTLQKDLIENAKQIEQRNDEIINEEEENFRLTKQLKKLPGEEAREQLRLYARSIEDKKGKLKTVNAELRVQRGKVTDLKYDLMQLDKQVRLLDIEWIQKQLTELKSNIMPQCANRLKLIEKTLTRERQKQIIEQFV